MSETKNGVKWGKALAIILCAALSAYAFAFLFAGYIG